MIAETPKKRIEYDPKIKQQILESADYYKKLLQEGLSAYNRLGLKTSINLSDLEHLGSSGEDFIREAVYSEDEQMQKLRFERSAKLAMIELPEGTADFVTALKKIKQVNSWVPVNGQINAAQLSFYSLKNDQVVISSALEDFAEQKSSTFTRNEIDVEIFDLFSEFIPKLQTLQEKYPNINFISEDFNSNAILKSWVHAQTNKRTFSFHPKNILR